ncbi:Lactoylglutathione lyase / glyoxalase I family protein [Tripterygium wilfordii]|uniref:Lactoylglutathione lyase / glyoxalase I family protein n=1 Tax=Tripterygium wilfordii TaxID=458696 RepID=A0A7J7DIS3_TRIWF|nr:uncharacterized protein At5g48480 [Tripterygium wilfordii]KAF5746265.1 Lactoylglutathione lyase / glyoxalase I family protein [Tripterygium wilfordii]
MAQQEVQNGESEKAAVAVVFTAVKQQLLVEAPKANDAVAFYKAAFGAVELDRTTQPKRKAEQELPLILSAQLQLAGSTIIVADVEANSATTLKTGGSGCVLCLETEDVEAAVAKAVAAGAVAEGHITEGEEGACCGGRVGKLKDPYGFVWLICSPAKKCATAEA